VILGVWSPSWREKPCVPDRNHQHLRVFQGGFDDKARRCHNGNSLA
jgi:hypothetical protein